MWVALTNEWYVRCLDWEEKMKAVKGFDTWGAWTKVGLCVLLMTLIACGCQNPSSDALDGGDVDAGMDGGDGGDGGEDASNGDDGGSLADASDSQGDEFVDPCAGVNCNEDQHCREDGQGQGVCVNNTCDDLDCGLTEVCEQTPGGGAICVDISCDQDVDCQPSEHCNGVICVEAIS
jgi:hypothetical protein